MDAAEAEGERTYSALNFRERMISYDFNDRLTSFSHQIVTV